MEQIRTAVISGGCGTLGRAIGKRLSKEGFNVIALYHTTTLHEAEAAIQEFTPGNHRAIQCDLRDADSIATAVSEIQKSHGHITACIHAAVPKIVRKNISTLAQDELREQLETSVFGGYNLFIKALPFMEKEAGMIIGILSCAILPEVTHARMAGYVVAKYALRGVLREFHEELRATRIGVNAIAPDFIDTNLHNDLPAEVRKFIAERGTTGSIKTPDDVARAIAFLCSPEGQSMRGKIFSLDEKETLDL